VENARLIAELLAQQRASEFKIAQIRTSPVIATSLQDKMPAEQSNWSQKLNLAEPCTIDACKTWHNELLNRADPLEACWHACRTCNPLFLRHCVYWILDHPDCIKNPEDRRLWLSCSVYILCCRGALELLQWLIEAVPDAAQHMNDFKMGGAAESGNLALIQWAFATYPQIARTEWLCAHAAGRGHVHVIQWARSQNPPFPWNHKVFEYAALLDRPTVGAWAEVNGLKELCEATGLPGKYQVWRDKAVQEIDTIRARRVAKEAAAVVKGVANMQLE
jgi:hypothetical protein